MSWREFEELVVSYFEANQYQAEHVGRDTADGGVDVSYFRGIAIYMYSDEGRNTSRECESIRKPPPSYGLMVRT